jgi:hypothetical protein
MARRRRQTTIGAVMITIAIVALCLGSLTDPTLGRIALSAWASVLMILLLVVAARLLASTAYPFSQLLASTGYLLGQLLASTAYLLGQWMDRLRKRR